MSGLSTLKSPGPPTVSKYFMNDIPRGTSLPKLIKCLQPPGNGQTSPSPRLHDVQVGVVIKDSRLDDELSVATIEFRDNPTWLGQDPCGFPKFTALGTLWRAIEWNDVDEHGRTEFMRAVMKRERGPKMGLCYAEMLAEFTETDVNIQDDMGRTALHWAAVVGRAEMVMLCLSVPECRIGLQDQDGLTAFDISLRYSSGNDAIPNLFYQSMFDMEEIEPQVALLRALTVTSEPATDRDIFPGAAMFPSIEDSNEELVEALITRGVDLTATNEDGDTALHVAAAKAGNVAITTRLLQAGSDVNAVGNHGATPLHYAVGTGDLGMVQLLLRHDADRSAADRNRRTALDLAEKDQKQNMVLLLKEGTTSTRAPVDVSPTVEVMVCVSPIAKRADYDQVPLSDIELSQIRGMSLIQAVRESNLEIVQLHMRSGKDLESKDYMGRTALHLAAEQGNIPIVQALLDAGAQIEARSNDDCTPLHSATYHGRLEAITALIAGGANIDTLAYGKVTPLHTAARRGQTEILKTLLTSGADLEVIQGSEKTPLLIASEHGHVETVKALLAGGANIRARSRTEETALHKAAENGHTETVKILLAAGVNVLAHCEYAETALHRAADNGHTETVQTLLTGGADVHALAGNAATALHRAAKYGHPETVQTLLNAGAKVNAMTAFGWAALHQAAAHGHSEVIRTLLARGAHIQAVSNEKETALHLAAGNRHTETVRVLLAGGANIDARCRLRETPLLKAFVNEDAATVQLLRAAGAQSTILDSLNLARLRATGQFQSARSRTIDSDY